LANVGIRTEPDAIARIEGEAGALRVVFVNGAVLERDALFAVLRQEPRTQLAQQLGCSLTTEGWFSGLIVVDSMNQTTVPGVFAAGDVMMPMQQISLAVASGTLAGAALHRSILAAGWQK
jgi:thioredoxin reductase